MVYHRAPRLDMVRDPRLRCLVALEVGRHDLLAAPLDNGKVALDLDDPEAGQSGAAAGAAATGAAAHIRRQIPGRCPRCGLLLCHRLACWAMEGRYGGSTWPLWLGTAVLRIA